MDNELCKLKEPWVKIRRARKIDEEKERAIRDTEEKRKKEQAMATMISELNESWTNNDE